MTLLQRPISTILEDFTPLNQQQREVKKELEIWLKEINATLDWYAEKAMAMDRLMTRLDKGMTRADSILAVCTELRLDRGQRASHIRWSLRRAGDAG